LTFGRYEILSVLGKGEMGSVYLVHDTILDRKAALKIPSLEQADESLHNIQHEARVMARLHHPNICPVYDAGVIDETPYMTMAYVGGSTLADRLQAGPMESSEAASLICKLASALHAAHRAGVLHRDLKPTNIVFDSEGEPVIIDFGLAQSKRDGASFAEAGVMLGTPAYMPPEQAMGSTKLIGPASDIYSLGVILFEMLTGRIPFFGDLASMLDQVANDDPPQPSIIDSQIDEELESICLKSLNKLPQERFRSARAMADALTLWLAATNSEG
jgi:serine/threonine protein kinase